jgi:formylglycine-generating enzyme required for sulfatase activity
MHPRIQIVLSFAAIVLVMTTFGCSDDDVTSPETVGTGTIVVNPTPNVLDAPWVISGPGNFSQAGNGGQTLTNLPAGQYSLAWQPVSGWTRPLDSQEELVSDGTTTFSGTYEEHASPSGTDVLIPPASVTMPVTFTMGGVFAADETPHQVTLAQRFLMSETEITNAQFVELLQWAYDQEYVTATEARVLDALDESTVILMDLDDDGSQIHFAGGAFSTEFPERPVVEVSWYGAAAYCDWKSLHEGFSRAYDHSTWLCNDGAPYAAEGYRLPTEAEWELACRAGTTTFFNTGDCLDSRTESNYNGQGPFTGCYAGPALWRTTDVGSFLANGWGLFGMHGSVWEWCNDHYGEYGGDVTDPAGPETGNESILRGGCWYIQAHYCRSAHRGRSDPRGMGPYYGFRVVQSSP